MNYRKMKKVNIPKRLRLPSIIHVHVNRIVERSRERKDNEFDQFLNHKLKLYVREHAAVLILCISSRPSPATANFANLQRFNQPKEAYIVNSDAN